MGTKEIKHGTSSGLLCLRVGKNFECDKGKNMISNVEFRTDFTLLQPPNDGTVRKNDQALNWCKIQCDTESINCVTFWFQQWLVKSDFGMASQWKCGFYSSPVDPSLRKVEADLSVASGCIC